jgi:hypothetical protein
VIATPSVRQILPPDIVQALKRAANTTNTAADPMARARAIEAVLQRARLLHPEFFRTEDDD